MNNGIRHRRNGRGLRAPVLRAAAAGVAGWLSIGGIAGLAALSSGCVVVTSGGCSVSTVSEERTFTVPHVSGTGLDVRARNGKVSVEQAPGDEVSIRAVVRAQTPERLAAVTVIAERVEDGRLAVRAEPPLGEWKSSEGVSFEIKVPDATGVKISCSNGRVEITGLSGAADLDTSNGAITVARHDGGVRARTSNGRVEIHDVTGPVNLRTSNGAVEVTNAGGEVDADTSNGRVTVGLAEGCAGPVRVDTSNGAVTLELGRAFGGELAISTSNGAIRIPESEAGSRIAVKSLSRGSAVLVFGQGPGSSVIKTSNGSVTVKTQ